MSINSGTIDGGTINSFGSSRRSIIINNLLSELYKAKKSNVSTGPKNHWRQERDDSRVIEPVIERIKVLVEFQDLSGVDEQELTDHLDVVYVTNLVFGSRT